MVTIHIFHGYPWRLGMLGTMQTFVFCCNFC